MDTNVKLPLVKPNVRREPRAPHLRASVSTARLGGNSPQSQVVRSQACALGHPREHARSYLLAFMERKDHIRPARSGKGLVGTRLTLESPADPVKRCEDTIGLGRRPGAHATAIEMD